MEASSTSLALWNRSPRPRPPSARPLRFIAESGGRIKQPFSQSRVGPITTEILDARESYHAEGYHRQHPAKNPWGYSGLGGTGVRCPTSAMPAK
jgi:peptide-methionine (S)-S-oxide reductase